MSTDNKPLRAFHGDPAIKEKYVNRLREHRRLENLIQGTGWKDGKGCAVGCTLEKFDHKSFEDELGLPEWLARLEDSLFESLPKGEAEQFAEDLLCAIPVGANIEPVRHQLAIARIEQALILLEGNNEPYANECRNALALVKAWNQGELSGVSSESDAAESAAESATRSAEAVAWSAYYSARRSAAFLRRPTEQTTARTAEYAARSAAYAAQHSVHSAAQSGADAAWSAAYAVAAQSAAAADAAESAHIKWERDTLLRLLREAK